MPDIATGLTSYEQAFDWLARALRGDQPAPGSITGRDISLDPAAAAPPPPTSAAPVTPQPSTRAFLQRPLRAAGQLPQGQAPGLFEQAMLAARGAVGLGGDESGDYSSPEGRDQAMRASGLGELIGLLAPILGAAVTKVPRSVRVPADLTPPANDVEAALKNATVGQLHPYYATADTLSDVALQREYFRLRSLKPTGPSDVPQQIQILEELAKERGLRLGGLSGVPAPEFPQVADELRVDNPITAYHGTPHQWEGGQFRQDRIGTGEGAAAYGHGGYFADVPDTARSYRQGDYDVPLKVGNRTVQQLYDQIENRADALGMPAAQPEYNKLALLEDLMHDRDVLGIEERAKAGTYDTATKAWFDTEIAPHFKAPGSLYQVNIHARPEQLLDFEKPFDQQSPEVQQALQALAYRPETRSRVDQFLNALPEAVRPLARSMIEGPYAGRVGPGAEANWQQLQQSGVDFAHPDLFALGPFDVRQNVHGDQQFYLVDRRTGEWDREGFPTREAAMQLANKYTEPFNLIHDLADERLPVAGGGRGESIYNNLASHLASAGTDDAAASRVLREHGVLGHRYLDQGSRATGAGTHNYVIYEPAIIEIAKKYGIALPVAAALYHQQQQEAQP